MKPINLTVISHACVLPGNQKVWAVVARHPDINLRLIAPQRWRSSLHGWVEFTTLPELQDVTEGVPVYCPGSLHLHTYRDLGPVLTVEVPDVLLLDEDPHSLVAWQVLGLQAIMSFQTIISLKQNLFKRYPFPFSLIERAIYRSASAAVASSEECVQIARQKHYRQPATVIHYPVDTHAFRPKTSGPPPPHRPLRVGYAGRLVPEKGVEDLIVAAACVQAQRPVELIIAGDGPDRKRLQDVARSLGGRADCILWQQVAPGDMPVWYQSLDLLVLPSRTTRRWKEQFGRAAAEAMACGVPVIGSDSGFIPEMIEATGGGVIYPEGDAERLAQAILELASDPARYAELARCGREGVTALYSAATVAQKIIELVRSVMG